MASIVARNYADALYELANENNDLEIIKDELNEICDVLNDNEELYKTLIHPSIEKKDKKEIFSKVFNDVNKLVNNTIMLLIDKNHLRLINEIKNNFNKLYREAKGIEIADVYSAKKLSDDELSQIKTILEKRTGKMVEINTHVNELLLAGVKIKINDEIIDNTLVSQMEKLKDKVDKEII